MSIMELESGRKPPPTLARCREIAKILALSPDETKMLIDAAMQERISDDKSHSGESCHCSVLLLNVAILR